MNQKRFEDEVLRGLSLEEFNKSFNMSDESPIWLIYFSAPWTESSKRLQPVWDAVANRLLGEEKYLAHKLNVRVAQVDC
jgi:hypothetical protein